MGARWAPTIAHTVTTAIAMESVRRGGVVAESVRVDTMIDNTRFAGTMAGVNAAAKQLVELCSKVKITLNPPEEITNTYDFLRETYVKEGSGWKITNTRRL